MHFNGDAFLKSLIHIFKMPVVRRGYGIAAIFSGFQRFGLLLRLDQNHLSSSKRSIFSLTKDNVLFLTLIYHRNK